MANDKLINHTQGESIITKLTSIADSLDDLTAISPAKFGMGLAVTNTPADTAAKTANIANFILTEGGEVNITFTYANTATNATLNINNTGAKPILYKGLPIASDIISAGDTCTFIYSSANGGSYNIINIDALSGAGAGTVKSVGASTGLKTDQPSGAAINTSGTVKLDLTSETPFEGTAPDPVEIEDKLYPVALDAAGHPAVSVPGTEYTQGAGINISENNVITNTGVFDVTAPTSSDTTATNGDIKIIKKVVNNGVTIESVEFVKPKGISDPAFKLLDSSTSGLTSDDNHVPTSKTVQDAIDTALASASIYKGTISAFNDLPTSTATDIVRKGWYYRVSTAWSAATGTPATHVGDIIIAEKDSPSKAIDSANWSLLHNEANTDANVTQSPVSTNANYEVLFSGSADNTSHTEGTGKDSGLTYNPSTNKLTVSGEVSASSYSGLPAGNTTTKGIVQLGTDADKAASGNHVHGNITNSGALQTTDVSIASGDKLVITDASDSNKVARASVSFDGSTATQALTKKGTFENFQAPISASNKLSSDFVDDTNKTHRFATADQLTQIATNKTNILYTSKTGAQNLIVCSDVQRLKELNPDSTYVWWEGNVYKSSSWTFTINGDGSITINGTFPAQTFFYFELSNSDTTRFKNNGIMRLTGCPSGGSENSYFICVRRTTPDYYWFDGGSGIDINTSEPNFITSPIQIFIGIRANVTLSNQTFYPSLVLKTIYEQDSSFHIGALPNYDLTRLEAEDRAALVEVVDSGAKNLIDLADKTITISGYAYDKTTIPSLPKGNYACSIARTNTVASMQVALWDSNNNEVGRFNPDDNYFTTTGTATKITVWVNLVGGSSSGTISNIMICTKAAFCLSNKFVPYRPNYDLVGSAVNRVENSLKPWALLKSGDDLNNIVSAMETQNAYFMFATGDTGVSNKPANGIFMVRTTNLGGGAAVQEVTMLTGNDRNKSYVRTFINSSDWSAWKETTNA